MKKQFLSIAVLFLVLALHAPLRAIGFKGGVNWEMNNPVGKYTQFVGAYSLRGASAWVDFYLLRKLAIGIEAGWHNAHENKPRATYQASPDHAFTAATYNSLVDIPLMANLKFLIRAKGIIRPYVNVGVGANYSRQEIVFLDQALQTKTWGFCFAPSIGTYLSFGRLPVGLNLYARYGVSFNQFEYQGRKLSPYQYVNVGVGILFQ